MFVPYLFPPMDTKKIASLVFICTLLNIPMLYVSKYSHGYMIRSFLVNPVSCTESLTIYVCVSTSGNNDHLYICDIYNSNVLVCFINQQAAHSL